MSSSLASLSAALTESPFNLEKVNFQTHGDTIGRLRVQAWRNERGIDPNFFARPCWVEVLDEEAEHWVITDNGVTVAAARLSWHTSLADVPYAYLLPANARKQLVSQRIAVISRMVVAPSHRGYGFSTLLDEVRVAEALANGAEVLTGATQLQFRQQALAKLGFTTLSELRRAPERPEWPLYFMVYHAVSTSPPAAARRPV